MTNEPNEKTTPPPSEVANKQIVKQEESLVNDYDIDAFLEKRKEFITKVNAIMVEGKDYHVIQGKKSLAKGGAEKIASIFGWSASFVKDKDVVDSFGDVKGLISFVCKLTKGQNQIGEGRGASTLSKNASDPNKTIKMAQKSAFIDAVLRASGLSDFFTQDLEDMPEAHITPNSAPSKAPSPKGEIRATPKQIDLVKTLIKQKGQSGKVTEEQINSLGIGEAKKWIDRLLKMEDQEDTNQINEPYVPNHEGD